MPNISALLTPNPFAGDDGSLPQDLKVAFSQPVAQRVQAIIKVLDRVLVPVIPHSHPGRDQDGRIKEHATAALDLSDDATTLHTHLIADGRHAVAVFSSVETLGGWNQKARPVPMGIESIALATLKQKIGQIVLDPGTEHETWISRSAVISLATGGNWLAPWADKKVAERLGELQQRIDHVLDIQITSDAYGRSVIDVFLPHETPVDRVILAAQELGRALEADPYLKARLDFVEIRPRQA
ncbi:SseB family protein [Arcanobacterium pinnipediorum]|uniref:SseB family protein n=1 Tax=Arcanobacterium pinnipediorum TaxID=1503041 RepID=A0ABY5AHJ9_9ACTO|nr:SseB family protein [Arcanobacterium pinnipediorum]USR78734.1 SseB family protein [Arcanobacterium pinnipediorum]